MSGARLRIVVFGYHTIGYRCLKELIQRDEEVCAVVTHADNPGESIWFESVAELARSAGIPVFSPNTPNSPTFVRAIGRLQPDLILSFYYRRHRSNAHQAIPRRGGINNKS